MLTALQLDLLRSKSILNLVFGQSDWSTLLRQITVENMAANQVVVREGDASTYCYIPLEGEVELFSDIGQETVINGNVLPGRTINTYSVLRNRNYQYSARFKTDGLVCKIPTELIQTRLRSQTELAKYLIAMTEDPDLRRMSKDIESFGCSTEFKIYLISFLEKKSCTPQEWLTNPKEATTEAFFLLEGQIVQQRGEGENASGNKVRQWQMPARTWLMWRALLSGAPSPHILKTISNATVLTLAKVHFQILRAQFPNDLEVYSNSILSGSKSTDDLGDEASEDIDLEEIIAASSVRRPLWKSYPWIQQSDQMDCGPACMAMVSRYYDRKLNIQYWRNQLSTNREGTSLYDLAQSSERSGFTAYALEVEDLSTLDSGFFPAIALRKYHYIVIYKVTKSTVIVGDPSVGIVKMSRENFAEGFENAVLFLKPTAKFFSIPESKDSYSHYWSMASGLQKEIALNFLVSLMIVGLGLFSPMLSQIFLDDILVRRDVDMLKLALAGAAVLTVLKGFLGWTRAYYANYLATKFDFNSHSMFMKKMLSLNYKYFADRHVGDFSRRVHELTKIKTFLLESVEAMILSVLSLVIYVAALFLYSPMVALTVLGTTPVFFLISFFAGKRLSQAYQVVFKESADLESNLTDTVKGISTVKALGAELSSRWRYEEKFIRLLRADRNFTLTAATAGVVAQFYSQFVNFLIMGLAAYMAIKGELSPGQVVATTMIAGNVLAPLTALAEQIGHIQEVKSVCERLNDVLLAPSEKVKNKGQLRKDFLRGEIEFQDVWFRYGGEGSDWVLKGLSFKIEAGQNVAFVGPSGSGKSTIAALIGRMFEPTKGQIFIDGRDYLEYDVDWLRAQIGVLHQESHLFQGSILENISISDPNPQISKIVDAATKAAADEFIQKKPGGYDYHISPGGLGLSGGEKQRVSLARTLYREPRILLLDEATSALDGIAEAQLLGNLKSQAQQLTTINIAHRYSTVKYSDFALVLKDGHIVGFGSHEELSEENEVYQQLFSPQLEARTNMKNVRALNPEAA